jgi:hypothetical protein
MKIPRNSEEFLAWAPMGERDSSLPWLTQCGKAVVVPAGALDDDPQIRPMQNIYCASRALWYREPAELPSHDELPVND